MQVRQLQSVVPQIPSGLRKLQMNNFSDDIETHKPLIFMLDEHSMFTCDSAGDGSAKLGP